MLRWFVPAEWGGAPLGERPTVEAYLQLGAACLATTFIITQPAGAAKRIAASDNQQLKARLLPGIASGERLASIGISHLTTSRQHLKRPMLAAEELPGGAYRLEGTIPWVTGGAHADSVVTGATLADGRQILLVLPTELPGVQAEAPERLIALTATHTGAITCRGVEVPDEWLLAGPVENVLTTFKAAGTGGLQTSTLALGVARAAVTWLHEQAQRRGELARFAETLANEQQLLERDLLALAEDGHPCTLEELRSRSNSLVLRAAQAALTAAKGSGYVVGHPAGRWCREALFFLVWSCPQPVMSAALCELAGLSGE